MIMAANQPVNRERAATYARPNVYEYETTAMITPTDRVRWGPILAGLFTVLASLVFFTTLGIALGLETFEAEQAQNFGIGAGIYGIISGLISFALGGFIAAKTAAVTGMGNAILQSGMVWIVTIALIVNFIGSGIGTILNVATEAAGAAANVAGDAAADVAQDPNAQATAQGLQEQAEQAVQDVTPQQVENVADQAADAAWWTLLALGLTALAALIGGAAGTRRNPTDIAADPRVATN